MIFAFVGVPFGQKIWNAVVACFPPENKKGGGPYFAFDDYEGPEIPICEKNKKVLNKTSAVTKKAFDEKAKKKEISIDDLWAFFNNCINDLVRKVLALTTITSPLTRFW